jgi:UDP-N-acetylglucosamine acyltransferase
MNTNSLNIHQNAKVHASVILEGNITIEEGVVVGPYCIIKGDVKLGKGTKLLGHVAIHGSVDVGQENIIYYFASIGTEPQDAKFKNERSEVVIGDNNVIREYVTINGGSEKGNLIDSIKNKTIVGNSCYLMIASHVAHDAILADNVVLSNNVAVAGHIKIENNVIIGGNTALHQFVHIGAYSMIGGMCAIGHNIPPFSIVQANASKIAGINIVGLKRNNFSFKEISAIKNIFHKLSEKNGKSIEEKLEQIKQNEDTHFESVDEIVKFIKGVNNRGIAEMEV